MENEQASYITLMMDCSFKATPQELFEAWSNPKLMGKWLMTRTESNKIAKADLTVGGQWEIVDHRNGMDYRAVGQYIEIDAPSKLIFTFCMPQFSDSEDTLTVKIEGEDGGCRMVFTQEIRVPHDEGWSEEEALQAAQDYHDASRTGWHLMFEGLKLLVEHE
ncbi:SRPBCC family protein [Paenibacillus sp. CAU 1782]